MISAPPCYLKSNALGPVIERCARYAAYRAKLPIILEGERGVGKSMLAQHFHELSRAPGRFIAVNAAEVPQSLAESFLLGHAKGSFTGASTTRLGVLEQAHLGTLFLDEVSHLSLANQELLLNALPTGRFQRLGEAREVKVDFRLISAANEDLEDLVRQGRMRRDFRDRLGPFSIRVPPLRERRDEILPMTAHYLHHLARQDGRGFDYRLSHEARTAFLEADWPGNLRSLWMACLWAAVHTDEEVIRVDCINWDLLAGPSHEPSSVTRPSNAALLADALDRNGGNKSATARDLGWSRSKVIRVARTMPSGLRIQA
jgi:DNA-binding NtrC family response regulator